MTMVKKIIAAGEFKSQCLALLDEVAATGQVLVVTKRGKPVAKVVPLEDPSPIDGSVVHCEDILASAIEQGDWEMIVDERR